MYTNYENAEVQNRLRYHFTRTVLSPNVAYFWLGFARDSVGRAYVDVLDF